MLILEAYNIKKHYSDRLIISFDELKVYSGDRIGIIGQNGSGKTTLLNILSKEIEPDEGVVRHYCELAYIRQFAEEEPDADLRLLKEFELSQKISQDVFSGGEQTRVKLANAFSKDKVLLMADEPTANLDYNGVELLKRKLGEVETFLLISHDRLLLDSLCNRIIEVRDGRLKFYNGNYTMYKGQSKIEFEQAATEYEKYLEEKSGLEEAISDRQAKAKSIRKAPKRMGNSEARLHKRSATERQQKVNNAVNSMRTRLDRLEVKERPRELPRIKLDFSLTNPPVNKIVISADGLNFGYGSREIFKNASFKLYNGLKTALWGENGSGKTTLLKLIYENNYMVYTVPKVKLGYFCQGLENLDYDKTVLENVMSESVQSQTAARTILARLLIAGDNVYKRTGLLSGGERIKVSFAKLFVSDANVLLLDEPANFLDMSSIEALEEVFGEYEGTVLFVSHDKSFVDSVADRLLVIRDKTIIDFDGSIEAYEAAGKKGISTERLAFQLKLTETVAKLSRESADKESLEAEYRELLNKLK